MAERSKTTIYLDDVDRESLAVIREATGCGTDAAAVRWAIRETARRVARIPKRPQRPDTEPHE